MTRRMVLFPEPLGPRMAVHDPAATSRVTASSAGAWSRENRFDTSLSSRWATGERQDREKGQRRHHRGERENRDGRVVTDTGRARRDHQREAHDGTAPDDHRDDIVAPSDEEGEKGSTGERGGDQGNVHEPEHAPW